jgi:hypothetical protein
MTTLRAILIAAAIASITAYIGPAVAAPAPDQQQADGDDDDCDDIMDELKELAEEVVKEQNVPMSRPAGCVAKGQLLGVIRASRAVAKECYGKGNKKLDDLLAGFTKAQQDVEKRIMGNCN